MDDHILESVLSRLDALEQRIANLESLPRPKVSVPRSTETFVAGPPPIVSVSRSTPPPPDPTISNALPPYIGASPNPGPVSSDTESTEMYVGTKVLPWAGAGALVLMFLYLVGMAYDRGSITPTTIFGAAAAGCLALIGIGQWRRGKETHFGELVTGIGSCGLYLDVAAGHLAQNLYPAETLVSLFFALSVANLTYCWIRKSKPFLGLGVTGGFLSVVMPATHQASLLAIGLYALILLPSFAIAVHQRWTSAVATIWFFGALTSLCIAFAAPRSIYLYGIYCFEGTAIAGYLAAALLSNRRVDEPSPEPVKAKVDDRKDDYYRSVWIDTRKRIDENEQWSPVASAITAVLIRLLVASPLCAYHLAGFTIAAVLAGSISSNRKLHNAMVGSPVFAALLLLPLCALPPVTFAIQLAITAFALLYGWRLSRAVGLSVAAAELVIATCLYAATQSGFMGTLITSRPEWAILGVAGILALSAGRIGRPIDDDIESAFLGLAAVVTARAAFLGITQTLLLEPSYAWTASILVAAIFALVAGFMRNLPRVRFASFAAFAIVISKIGMIDLSTSDPMTRVVLLLVLGIALLGGGYWYTRRSPKIAPQESDKPTE